MTDFLPEYPPGATPLDANEIAGLIPDYISTHGELNLLEQANILQAQSWATRRKHSGVLNDSFVRSLHQRMFKDVWKWAGRYRLSDKSIGVPWQEVAVEIRKLCCDAQLWIKDHGYPWDELGARFHHRLVLVHAFPNGNGRHARLMTDVLMASQDQAPFSWGRGLGPGGPGAIRSEYVAALREADQKKIGRLVKFVRS